jgi:hypothetical protein
VFEVDQNGNPTAYSYGQNNFSFSAANVGLEYSYKKFNFTLGSYSVPKGHNFTAFGTSSFGIPYLQVSYNVGKF